MKSNDDSVCGIISVHPLKCPLTDITTEDNMNDDEVRDVTAIYLLKEGGAYSETEKFVKYVGLTEKHKKA